MLKQTFARGHRVGRLARQLFPNGIDLTPLDSKLFDLSVIATKYFIDKGATVLYEASFIYDQVLCAVDILVKQHDGWHAYEVKSSTKINETLILDASAQYFVLTNSGIDLQDISLVTLNRDYFRGETLDVHSLFKTVSVINEARENQALIAEKIQTFKEVVQAPAIPEIEISPHCDDPYSCDFKHHCFCTERKVPEHGSVFDISGLFKRKQHELFRQGILSISQIPADYKLNPSQRIQADNKEIIDKQSLSAFLSMVKYPCYFMHLDSVNPAVPYFTNTQPYQTVPVLYSLAYLKSTEAKPVFYDYMASFGPDPIPDLIAHLLSDIKAPGNIVIYNNAKKLQSLVDYAMSLPSDVSRNIVPALQAFRSRIIDLYPVFHNHHYYHPYMAGTFSFKNIIYSLIPEFNEEYKLLPIQNSIDAQEAYDSLAVPHDSPYQTSNRVELIRQHLIDYAHLSALGLRQILVGLSHKVSQSSSAPANSEKPEVNLTTITTHDKPTPAQPQPVTRKPYPNRQNQSRHLPQKVSVSTSSKEAQ